MLDPPVPPNPIRLRYPATCRLCSASLERGTRAYWDRHAAVATCVICADEDETTPPPAAADVAGGSAQRRHDKLSAAREARIRAAHPRLGGVMLALSDDPQSTRAWSRGAEGERRLGKVLSELDVVALHDRRIPGSQANIDHIVVCALGVFVIDAKYYHGMVEIRDKGGWLRSDRRLYVGGRDCSKLARAMATQVECVVDTLHDVAPAVPVFPVLCFVDAEWPLMRRTDEFEGVRLEGLGTIRRLLTRAGSLTFDQVTGAADALTQRLRPA